MSRSELDINGNFLCDIDSAGSAPFWTASRPPQPINSPRYSGLTYNPLTGECSGGTWVDDGVPSAEDADLAQVSKLLCELRVECDRRLACLKDGYPESEVLSWDKQETEARAGGGPLVAALATARGIDEAELISRILQKAQVFAVLSGTIIGQRQAIEDRIKAGAREFEWPE